jgi:hypothetical protein
MAQQLSWDMLVDVDFQYNTAAMIRETVKEMPLYKELVMA